MIRAVIFDTHGVVLTGERFSTLVKNKDENILKQVITFIKYDLQKYLRDHKHLEEAVATYVNRLQEKPREDFLKYWIASEQYVNRKLAVFIIELRHRGIRCYLSTSQDRYKVDYMKESMGLGLIFDDIFSSAAFGVAKTDRAFFAKIAKQLPGLSVSEILYWDDMSIDVEMAKESGFQAEVYKNFDDFRKKMEAYLRET